MSDNTYLWFVYLDKALAMGEFDWNANDKLNFFQRCWAILYQL